MINNSNSLIRAIREEIVITREVIEVGLGPIKCRFKVKVKKEKGLKETVESLEKVRAHKR